MVARRFSVHSRSLGGACGTPGVRCFQARDASRVACVRQAPQRRKLWARERTASKRARRHNVAEYPGAPVAS